MSYVVYEKTYIERLGELVEDETNLCDSNSIDSLIKKLNDRNIKVARATLYKAIKTKKAIYDKYFVYKIKL